MRSWSRPGLCSAENSYKAAMGCWLGTRPSCLRGFLVASPTSGPEPVWEDSSARMLGSVICKRAWELDRGMAGPAGPWRGWAPGVGPVKGCREGSSVGVPRRLGLQASEQPHGSRLSALAPLWATERGSYCRSRNQGRPGK